MQSMARLWCVYTKTIMNESKPGENGNQQPATQDDTTVQQTVNNPNTPQQGEVNKTDNNTKLGNEADSGDLNDDD